VAGWISLSAYTGLYWGAWTAFIAFFQTPRKKKSRAARSPIFFVLAGAALWVILEYTRGYLFSGFLWGLLGNSQWRVPWMIQMASITGVYGVSFLIVVVNLAIAGWWNMRSRAAIAPLVLAGSLAVISVIFGSARVRRLDAPSATPAQNVAILQGNVLPVDRFKRTRIMQIFRRYEGLMAEAAPSHPDLIVWPESSLPLPLLGGWAYPNLDPLLRKTGTEHIIGSNRRINRHLVYNSAYSYNPRGVIQGFYDKHHLVPFGEYIPGRDLGINSLTLLDPEGQFTAGTTAGVLPTQAGPAAMTICMEDIYPGPTAEAVANGKAVVLINLSNDGWFTGTAELSQHLSADVFRAVESERWLLRAANTGISAIIDPAGRVTAASMPDTVSVLRGSYIPRTNLSLYDQFGDVFVALCFFMVLACFVL